MRLPLIQTKRSNWNKKCEKTELELLVGSLGISRMTSPQQGTQSYDNCRRTYLLSKKREDLTLQILTETEREYSWFLAFLLLVECRKRTTNTTVFRVNGSQVSPRWFLVMRRFDEFHLRGFLEVAERRYICPKAVELGRRVKQLNLVKYT